MTKVIERTEGHYEVQMTSYGRAYVWCPACIVVECDCGEKMILTAPEGVCRCGADHAMLVRQELIARPPSNRNSHPWDAEYHAWRRGQDDYLRAEYHDWMDGRIIE